MRGFDRNTMWVAMGLLGTVICAALVLVIQEHHQSSVEVAEKAVQNSGEVLPNDTPVALSEVADWSGKITDEISSEREKSVEDQADVQASRTLSSPVHRHDPARVIRPKTPSASRRPSKRPNGFVNVRMRLLALWHQSLARIKRSSSWAPFSNLDKEGRRRVGYTAETTH
jgi:hypothetical protein